MEFKTNPFMILGVSADAEISEIRQVAKRSLMELSLSGEEDPEATRRIENALETLQDPVKRFHWGLFWPELTVGEAERFRTDPVLSALADDQCQDAAGAYERISECDSVDVRAHNIGVLALLRAVAATEVAQKGTPDDIEDDLECVPIWQEAFQHLKIVIGSERFWIRQKLRAKALEDARLDSARVAEFRKGLLAEILAPAGSVITRALLAGHSRVAKVYVGMLRTSEFDKKFIEETLSNVYEPLATRVEKEIEKLKERLKEIIIQLDDKEFSAKNKTPVKKAAKNRVFLELLESFETEVLKDLDVMLAVGDLPGYAEEHARDTAAEFLRSLSVVSWNTTEEIKISQVSNQLALRFADAESLKSAVAEDSSQIKQIIKNKDEYKMLMRMHETLDSLLKKESFKEALGIIDELIAVTSGEDMTYLKELRQVVSSRIATDHQGCMVVIIVWAVLSIVAGGVLYANSI